ncbi:MULTISPECIES: PHP domain-containing protein [unclassified Thalassolituus]|uniref:PHP domain-containing protein n=1 Tax=unclassified Thalassolituus TaxID=2624967 RepID=UPI0025F4A838|nr:MULTISPECIES: PHP domain-containing protein [unclassified Thalassolituus]
MISDIDLHCHSTASDGKLAPEDLVARAAERGIRTLAITDHDTAEGFRRAQSKARELDVRLIPGIELSCVWGGITVHLVGLNFDPDSEAMQKAEAIQADARAKRSEVITERLSKRLKHEINLADVQAYAGGDQVGRPHFAQYLIDRELVPSMNIAFSKYLGAGKPGDVKTGWPELADAVEWIVQAGGIPVVAHAHLYKMTRTKLRHCLTDFIDAGGRAIEVAYGQMDNNQRGQMSQLAKEFGLMGSCGSDFHGPNRFGLDLGVMPSFPKEITPVWHSWQDAV